MDDTCLETRTLVELVEGRAADDVRARIEQHASRCDECRRVLSSLALSETLVASDSEQREAPPRTVGRYRIEHELGAGGMGIVYAAFDPELGRTVAVKLLHDTDPAIQERLRREAQTMAQLAHPNVVAVHDVGVVDGRMFVAMERVAGESLARWLVQTHTTAEILDAFRAAGRGLAAAHAAGIVHRDFKPENVLVGTDGRVRVGDFGLARPTGASGSQAAAETGAVAQATTDAIVGTPYYLSPERVRGRPADAASDQFSFCVALYTALYRERPFDGTSLRELADNAEAGRIREPSRTRGVPRRVQRAVRRGLAGDPRARFPSLEALLAELAPPRRVLRIALPVAGAIAVASVIAAWAGAHAADPDRRCTGAAEEIASAWNPQRRAALEQAFAASHLPFAAAASRELVAVFDRYATRWIAGYTDACRATHVRGDQTGAMLDRRMSCLARRRQELAAHVDALTSSDPSVVAHAVEVADRLGDVSACADLAALSQAVPPADLATRARMDAVAQDLAVARAQADTGHYKTAIEAARRVAAIARSLGYRPFEAEAELVQGDIERSLGETAHARATLEAAVWSAEAGRADDIAARAWVDLVVVVGYDEADHARGEELAQRASAAIARLGGNPEIEAWFEQAQGAIAGDQNKLDEAVQHYEKALKLEEQQFGPDSRAVAMALGNLALAVMLQGHTDRAIELNERALAIYQHTVGPDHPSVANVLHNLGNAHFDAGDYPRAEKELRQALAIREAAFRPTHPDIATVLSDLSRAVRRQGRLDEAIALDRRAVTVGETAFGPDSPTVAQMLVHLGISLNATHRYDEATPVLARAEAIQTKLSGPDAPDVAAVQVVRADALLARSRPREAVAIYEHAIPILSKSEGLLDARATAIDGLAQAYLDLHQADRVMRVLEQASGVRDQLPPERRASLDYLAAQALWESGGDRGRARTLATSARDTIAASNPADHDGIANIDAWLARHPVR
jgi:tetratricopeptide (TPR) repeat protein